MDFEEVDNLWDKLCHLHAEPKKSGAGSKKWSNRFLTGGIMSSVLKEIVMHSFLKSSSLGLPNQGNY